MEENLSIGERIRLLRKRLEWSQEELCRRAGIDRVTLSYIETGKREPGYGTVEKIAQGFGISVSELSSIPREEEGNGRYPETSKGNIDAPPIPLLGYVEAGRYAVSYSDGEYPTGSGMAYVERGRIRDPNAYAVVVQGESMLPTLRPGFIVVALPNAEAVSNDLVVCRLKTDEEVVVKRIRIKDQTIILESDNKAYETIILDRQEILFYHKVAAIYPT